MEATLEPPPVHVSTISLAMGYYDLAGMADGVSGLGSQVSGRFPASLCPCGTSTPRPQTPDPVLRKRVKVHLVEAARYDVEGLTVRLGAAHKAPRRQAQVRCEWLQIHPEVVRERGGFFNKASVEAALRKDAELAPYRRAAAARK